VRPYRICDLEVSSEFELPGANPSAGAGPAEVVIRRGAVPRSLPSWTLSGPNWEVAGRRLRLDVPGIAQFLLTEGREIVVEPESEARLPDIPIFILCTAFGILLHQREEVVLQASAVSVHGKAVLFCGPSGAGKSTLAAALAERGHAMISDDLCALDLAGSTPLVRSDGTQLRLWAQAINQLRLGDRRGGRVRPSLEKYDVSPPARTPAPTPLGAVYVLRETRPPYASGIERPNLVDATVLVGRSAYRPLLARDLGQKALYFRAAARILSDAGLFHLTRPFAFPDMPRLVESLERHWQTLALSEVAA
jgi:hypothetical protein